MAFSEKDVIEASFEKSIFSCSDSNGLSESMKLKTRKKAYCDAYMTFYKTIYLRSMVGQFMSEGKVPNADLDPTMRQLIEYQINQTVTKPPYIFLTVNPSPDITLPELKKAIEKFIKKKSITLYFYVFEVRDKDSGLHCHILLKYINIKPFDFKRSAKNTFKNVCDSSNPHCLNFKFIECAILPDKIQYLLGEKQDKKLKGVSYSKEYRVTHKLQEFYESSPPFPCRTTQTQPVIEEL